MADNNEEINVIAHLLQVEKNASLLIDNALKEAEQKLAQARSQANLEFKQKYEACVGNLENEYNQKLNEIQTEHDKLFDDFKESLQSQPKNNARFNNLLESLLFADK
jgi:F0F1-type ATP synthase membrane subunit b/b'